MCVSHFPRFSVFLPKSYSVNFSFFQVFQCFSQYSRSYQVIFSFSLLVSFLATFQVLQGAFLIFHVFHCISPYSMSYHVSFSFFTFFTVPCHIPSTTVRVSHFARFSLFLPIFQLLQCVFLILHFFSVSRHIKCPTM